MFKEFRDFLKKWRLERLISQRGAILEELTFVAAAFLLGAFTSSGRKQEVDILFWTFPDSQLLRDKGDFDHLTETV